MTSGRPWYLTTLEKKASAMRSAERGSESLPGRATRWTCFEKWQTNTTSHLLPSAEVGCGPEMWSAIGGLVAEAGVAARHEEARVLEHAWPVPRRGEAPVGLVDAEVSAAGAVVGGAEEVAAQRGGLRRYEQSRHAARNPEQPTLRGEFVTEVDGRGRCGRGDTELEAERGGGGARLLGGEDGCAQVAVNGGHGGEGGEGLLSGEVGREVGAEGGHEVCAAGEGVGDVVVLAGDVGDGEVVLLKVLRPPHQAT
jgi:hypothetical protein